MKQTILFLICFFTFFSCSNQSEDDSTNTQKKVITVKGSDTVFPIINDEIPLIGEAHPNISISIAGGGSGDGIKALLEQSTDVAMASRDVKDKELKQFKEKGIAIKKEVIAYDALMVVVNEKNPISKLTREQIEAIYTGKITNWKELGGKDQRIEVYSRDESSGTNAFFKEVVLEDKSYTKDVLSTFSTEAIVQSVIESESGIGYIGLGYHKKGLKALALSFDNGNKYIYPSINTAKNKTYPVARPLFIIYDEKESEKVKELVDFTYSNQGQNIVKKIGYIEVK